MRIAAAASGLSALGLGAVGLLTLGYALGTGALVALGLGAVDVVVSLLLLATLKWGVRRR